VLRRIRGEGEAIERRIRAAIDELRPLLRVDESDIELVGFDEESGVATLRLAGGCPHCDLRIETLLVGITAHLRMRVPEIREVHQSTDTTDE
jgi:Fe-S cluster biogenesis protein NfuA